MIIYIVNIIINICALFSALFFLAGAIYGVMLDASSLVALLYLTSGVFVTISCMGQLGLIFFSK
jgi:ABC-type protease/lipase transport system fused ATPase/permease subunit